MQLRAMDEHGQMIYAHQAHRHTNYFCKECNGILRLRSGLHRQRHFFHLKTTTDCRQNGKGMEHLLAQQHIKEIIGQTCDLEYSFPEIARIADCVWHAEKIVFEIQCSPITQAEVMARQNDYAKAGYQVVWLLNDKRFNQKKLCAAEVWLRHHPHYFLQITTGDVITIYDQWDMVERGLRKTVLEPAQVDLKVVKSRAPFASIVDIPLALRQRAWPIFFMGDWIDRSLDEKWHLQLLAIFQPFTLKKQLSIRQAIDWCKGIVGIPYRLLFYYWLEKLCR